MNKTAHSIKSLGLLAGVIVAFHLASVVSAEEIQTRILQNNAISVAYEPPLEAAAGEVLQIYPLVKQELEQIFTWHLDVKPRVVLINSSRTFSKLAGSPFFVGFAVPARNLIVIDYTKMKTRPFNLRTTFKHELCHLLLHRHINDSNLPRWLNEGVCQLASDGIGEILLDKSWSGLDAAVMAGRTLRLARLAESFPGDKNALMLAYEQSKSVVTYIDRQYGSQVILDVLGDLRNGEDVEIAIAQRLSLTISELERNWLSHLESTPRWLVFLASHIYAILFFLAAVSSILGFIRYLRHKRKIYAQWEDEEEED